MSAGYASRSQPLSATRTYPNLSDADASLIPKAIEEKGKTLALERMETAMEQAGELSRALWVNYNLLVNNNFL